MRFVIELLLVEQNEAVRVSAQLEVNCAFALISFVMTFNDRFQFSHFVGQDGLVVLQAVLDVRLKSVHFFAADRLFLDHLQDDVVLVLPCLHAQSL